MSDLDINASTKSLWTSISEYRKNPNNSKQSMRSSSIDINSHITQLYNQIHNLSHIDEDKLPSDRASIKKAMSSYSSKSFEVTTLRNKISEDDELIKNDQNETGSFNDYDDSSRNFNQKMMNMMEYCNENESEKTTLKIKNILNDVTNNNNNTYSIERDCEFVRKSELEKVMEELSKMKQLLDERDKKISQLENVIIDMCIMLFECLLFRIRGSKKMI